MVTLLQTLDVCMNPLQSLVRQEKLKASEQEDVGVLHKLGYKQVGSQQLFPQQAQGPDYAVVQRKLQLGATAQQSIVYSAGSMAESVAGCYHGWHAAEHAVPVALVGWVLQQQQQQLTSECSSH